MSNVFNTILCPVDLEGHSAAALELARELAIQNDATICLFHTSPLPMTAAEFAPLPLEPLPEWERSAREGLEKLAAEQLAGKVKYRVETATGDAIASVLEAARKFAADLIVMTTHGRKGMSHFLMGSIVEDVIRESPCPVLAVRIEPGAPKKR